MITKYRYTYQTQTIETLDLSSIPNGVPYETIVISDAEIKAIEDAKIQAQKTAEAQSNQVAKAQEMLLNETIAKSQTATDTEALNNQTIYPMWVNGKSYIVGEKCQSFNANNELKLYKCVQAHTSQSDWKPINVPALFTEIQPAGTIGVWKQPTGAQDAYQLNDLVHFPTITDPIYKSTAANNVWQPLVYGWVLN